MGIIRMTSAKSFNRTAKKKKPEQKCPTSLSLTTVETPNHTQPSMPELSAPVIYEIYDTIPDMLLQGIFRTGKAAGIFPRLP